MSRSSSRLPDGSRIGGHATAYKCVCGMIACSAEVDCLLWKAISNRAILSTRDDFSIPGPGGWDVAVGGGGSGWRRHDFW